MKEPVFSKRSLLKLAFESSLIIFSVMLALVLDEYRVNLKQEAATQKALSNVQQEMISNLEVLQKWQTYHSEVYEKIDEVLNAERIPLSDFTQKNGEIHYYSVIPDAIFQNWLEDSSWEVFKSSNAYTNLEFETVVVLSRIYKLQDSGVQASLKSLLTNFTQSDFFEEEKLRHNLTILRRYFREIVSQEAFLIMEYQKALNYLEEQT